MAASRFFWFLIVACAAIAGVRLARGGVTPEDLGLAEAFAFEQSFTIHAAPGQFSLGVYIPRATRRFELIDERFETGALSSSIEQTESGRRLTVTGAPSGQPIEVRYAATIVGRAMEYDFSPGLTWDTVMPAAEEHLTSTALVQADAPEVRSLLATLFQLDLPTSASADDWRTALGDRGLGPAEALSEIFRYCQWEIAAAPFSGSTDALTALRLGESSCGGKSRLMAALARAVGIPTRLVGGVIVDGRRKRTSHVWVESQIAGEWIPFDPLNDHFARVEANYLTLYHGDASLIEHSRGLSFDYRFNSKLERVPRTWLAEGNRDASGSGVPLLRRSGFTVMLLAPFALLFTVFVRQVVGVNSMGVFLPVLLGFSISQAGWLMGGGQLLAVVLIGIPLRFVLTRLNLLHVPRNAVLITAMVGLFMGISVTLEALGILSDSASLVLPMAALAMTIERYTVHALDRGHGSALALLGQTFALAVGCHAVLTASFFKGLTVSFPEIFLLVVALLVMVGNYRGMRLRELWRFRSLRSTA